MGSSRLSSSWRWARLVCVAALAVSFAGCSGIKGKWHFVGKTSVSEPVVIELDELSGLPAPFKAAFPGFTTGKRYSTEYIRFKGDRFHWYSWPSNDYGSVSGWVPGDWRRRSEDENVVEVWQEIWVGHVTRSAPYAMVATARIVDGELHVTSADRDAGSTVTRFKKKWWRW